jgi:hypothetical protein
MVSKILFLLFSLGALTLTAPSAVYAQTSSLACQQDAVSVCTSEGCTCEKLRIDAVSPLSFGRFSSSQVGGSVIIRPQGSPMIQGGVTMVGGDLSAAHFRIYGPGGTKFRVLLPALGALQSGGTRLQMRDLTLDRPDGIYTIEGSGYADLWVGATLTVPGNLDRGTFDGPFDLDLEVIR